VARDQEVERILRQAAQAQAVDFEAVETAVRAAVLRAGAQVLEAWVAKVGCGPRTEPVRCACGRRMQSRGVVVKRLETLLGPVRDPRSRFVCPPCGRVRYPGDEALDVVGAVFSPGLRRMMTRAGARGTFQDGAQDLAIYAEVHVSPKSVERVAEAVGADMERWAQAQWRPLRTFLPADEAPAPGLTFYIEADGTGIPMIAREVQGRRGKQPDGSARTREAKLGCVFTQTTLDAEGRPVRDPASTSWVGAIEDAEAFGWRLFSEAVRRGLYTAPRVVVLGDGAEWIRRLVELHFPGALFIIDLYHAKEHVARLVPLLFFHRSEKLQGALRDEWWDLLEQGRVETLLERARALLPKHPLFLKEIQRELAYLDRHKDHMRYADYQAQGLFIGSGIVEAGCGHIIGHRFKQSGMEWSVRGANAILAARCTTSSRREEDYYADRALLP
jgi:hypothetical protein